MPKLQTLKPRIGVAKLSRVQTMTTDNTGAGRERGSRGVRSRERIRERDCDMCQECKRQGRTTGVPKGAGAVDHIRPLWEGGSNDPSNLQLLCDPCHDAKSAEEAKRRGC